MVARRRSRSATAAAAAEAAAAGGAGPNDAGPGAARGAPRQRVEEAEAAIAPPPPPPLPPRADLPFPADGPALAPEQNLQGARAAMARIARARAAHFAVFDEDEGRGGEPGPAANHNQGDGDPHGGGGPRAAVGGVMGAVEHVGGEEARGLGMWAAAAALEAGRGAAAAARERRLQEEAEAEAEAAAVAARAAAPAWAPTRDAAALGPRPRRAPPPGEAAPWAAAAGVAPPPPGRVPSLADLAARLIAANFWAVDSLAGVPDSCRARLAHAAAAARTLDARAARLLAGGGVGSLVLPDATALDAAGLAAVLAAAASPRLEALDLGFCGRGLGTAAATALAAAGPLAGLDSAAFRGAYRVTDPDLATVLGTAPRLRALAVSHAPLLTGAGSVDRLPSLTPHLTALDLSHCRGVGRGALWAGLVGREAPPEPGPEPPAPTPPSQERQQQQQRPRGGAAAGGGAAAEGAPAPRRRPPAQGGPDPPPPPPPPLAPLALPPLPGKPTLPHLASLTLDGLGGAVDDLLAAALGAALPALARVSLAQTAVTDAGVAALATREGARLRAVNFSGCALTDAALDALAAVNAGGGGGCGLEEVRLGGCALLSDAALARLVTAAAPTLRVLAIPSLPHAGPATATALLACVGLRGSLATLDVSWCRGIPGDGLAALADKAGRRGGGRTLTRLDTYGVSQLSASHLHGHGHDGLDVRGAVADVAPPPMPAGAVLVLPPDEEEEEGEEEARPPPPPPPPPPAARGGRCGRRAAAWA